MASAVVKPAPLALNPATTTLTVGHQVTETATLTDGGGAGLPNATVAFTVTSGPDAGQSGSAITNQAGQASFSYTGTAIGTDSIVASVATAYTVGPLQSSQTSVTWTNNPTPTLTLSPTTTTQIVGQQVTETALLLDGSGNGISNSPVTFNVTSGPDAGQTGSANTDTTGHASFTYTGAGVGTDTVVASATVTSVGTFQSNQTSVIWTNNSTAGWSFADIGSPPIAGSQSLSNGIWTVSGSGRDIGGTADQFHFVWQTLASDGGIRAQVLTQTNTNSRARAGVMLRLSSDPGSPFYMVVVTPSRGIFVLERATQGSGVTTV